MITLDSKNILISDDSLSHRTRLCEILVSAGHSVRYADGAEATINHLESNAADTDLIILGMNNGSADCTSVLTWISEHGYSSTLRSLVVVEGKVSVELMEFIRKLGATGLIKSDFPPEQLIFRVNRALYPDKMERGVNPRGRITLSLPVEYVFAESNRDGKLLNISTTGTYLHTDTEMLVGSKVVLRFSLPGSERVFEVKGRVTRTTADSERKSLFSGCGIKFTSIGSEETRELERYIEGELRRMGLGAAT